MDLIFVGMPASGKSTQTGLLAQKYDYKKFVAGETLKAIIKSGTERGRYISSIIDGGGLLPSDFVNEAFDEVVQDFSVNKFIIDGYPRKLAQLEHLFAVYEKLERDFMVIYLMVDQEQVMKRIKIRLGEQNRVDDSSVVKVQARIANFNEFTAPILDIIDQRGLLVRIDGMSSVAEVTQELEAKLGLGLLEYNN